MVSCKAKDLKKEIKKKIGDENNEKKFIAK